MTPNQIKKKIGISYLGGCNTPKLLKSKGQNVLTYGVYLAPYNLSGYNVCPQSHECHKYCLNGSGRNKLELFRNKDGGVIQQSRIRKTKLFFEDKSSFMTLLCYEIIYAIRNAQKNNMQLAVRLNCTSDINIEDFTCDGRNILEIFPDVQFYDYTKVYSHISLSDKYKNYDLTFSYDGTNWTLCDILLKKGYRIAVVFENNLPETFRGYPVIDANTHDARFLDAGGIICGLTYKKVANDYVDGKYQRPDTVFVNRTEDGTIKWCSAKLKQDTI